MTCLIKREKPKTTWTSKISINTRMGVVLDESFTFPLDGEKW